jgi:hypothetical protein
LQCVLAAKILTEDFVVCALAVQKKMRVGFDMSDRTIPLSVSSVYFKQERPSHSRVKLEASFTGEADERGQWSTRLCFYKNKSLSVELQ